MPCDIYFNVTVNDEYVNVIEYLMHENEFIICGDFNTCYAREIILKLELRWNLRIVMIYSMRGKTVMPFVIIYILINH